jgi:hypothetical protein
MSAPARSKTVPSIRAPSPLGVVGAHTGNKKLNKNTSFRAVPTGRVYQCAEALVIRRKTASQSQPDKRSPDKSTRTQHVSRFR